MVDTEYLRMSQLSFKLSVVCSNPLQFCGIIKFRQNSPIHSSKIRQILFNRSIYIYLGNR